MKSRTILALFLALAGAVHADTIINFDGLYTSGGNTYDLPGTDGTHDWFQSGVGFSRTVSFGGASWDGMTYSSVNAPATPGFGNQYAVYGNGLDRSGTGSYAVFFQPFTQRTIISLPVATTVNGFYLNNTAYAALDMQNGSGFSKQFTTNDWFKLTVEGFDASGTNSLGTVDFNLADFTGYSAGDNRDTYMVTNWSFVNLSGLGTNVSSLGLSLSSSDNGSFGMNTPAYFAMDDLSVAAIPEPGTVTMMLIGFGGLAWFRRRRNYFFRS